MRAAQAPPEHRCVRHGDDPLDLRAMTGLRTSIAGRAGRALALATSSLVLLAGAAIWQLAFRVPAVELLPLSQPTGIPHLRAGLGLVECDEHGRHHFRPEAWLRGDPKVVTAAPAASTVIADQATRLRPRSGRPTVHSGLEDMGASA